MKTSLLLIQEKISHYDIDLYNELNKSYDLTVLCSESFYDNYSFKTIFVPTKKVVFKIHEKNIYKIANNYDVVIDMLQLSHFYTYFMLFSKRKFRYIMWGIGVAAGYNTKYDSSKLISFIYRVFIKHSDAVIFYSDYPKNKYIKYIDSNKMFVANNTVKINKIDFNYAKKDFLFIGTLYKEKGINLLIDEYIVANSRSKNLPKLWIIGDGPEYNNIFSRIKMNNLEKKIIMLGRITDEKILSNYYKKVLLCISPNQAGLSVQKSMGYGSVFVTSKNSITGGEIFDIIDGKTGILFDNYSSISEIMIDSINNKEKYLEIAKNAYDFYWKNRTIDKKINGFIEAINYVSNL